MQRRRIVVAGGGNGIGRAAAELFAADGAEVHVLDFDAAAAASTIDTIRAAGGTGQAWDLDITDETASRRVFDAIAEYGAIDVAVSSVGIEHAGPTPEVSLAEWRRVIDVNLTGAFIIARLALSHMMPLGRGAIVLTSSVHAQQTAPGWAAYAASKGGIDALTRALALEAASRNVRVNTVAPGATDTPMLVREAGGAHNREAAIERFSANNPSGRVATPAEVAALIAFLASDASSFVTGTVIPVDGGGLAAINGGPVRPVVRFPIPTLASRDSE